MNNQLQIIDELYLQLCPVLNETMLTRKYSRFVNLFVVMKKTIYAEIVRRVLRITLSRYTNTIYTNRTLYYIHVLSYLFYHTNLICTPDRKVYIHVVLMKLIGLRHGVGINYLPSSHMLGMRFMKDFMIFRPYAMKHMYHYLRGKKYSEAAIHILAKNMWNLMLTLLRKIIYVSPCMHTPHNVVGDLSCIVRHQMIDKHSEIFFQSVCNESFSTPMKHYCLSSDGTFSSHYFCVTGLL